MIGWRGRIGKVCPGDWHLDYEYGPILPDGVVMYTFTLGLEKIIPSEIEAIFNKYVTGANMLATQEVNVIVLAGTPVQTYMGYDKAFTMSQKLAKEIGVPVISDLTAAFDSLKAFNAKRIVMVSPYEKSRNIERKKLCESQGFEVLHMKGMGLQRRVDMSKLPPYQSYQTAKEAYYEAPEAEAIWISCPEWLTVRNIAKLENDTGKPVITSVTSIIYAALKAIHVKDIITGFGKLLEIPR